MGSKEKYWNQSEEDQQNRASKDQPQLKSIFRDGFSIAIPTPRTPNKP